MRLRKNFKKMPKIGHEISKTNFSMVQRNIIKRKMRVKYKPCVGIMTGRIDKTQVFVMCAKISFSGVIIS